MSSMSGMSNLYNNSTIAGILQVLQPLLNLQVLQALQDLQLLQALQVRLAHLRVDFRAFFWLSLTNVESETSKLVYYIFDTKKNTTIGLHKHL